MKKLDKPNKEIKKESKKIDFLEDYDKIINSSVNSVIVKTEWQRNGDFFQKLSMYDNTYSPVKTLGHTTLIIEI